MEAELAVRAAATRRSGHEGRFGLVVSVLIACLAICVLVSLTIGAARIPLGETLRFLAGDKSLSDATVTVLSEVRLPRLAAAAMVGSALSVAGLLFQGLFRNPLADPYVIGSSGGAALGAAAGFFLLPQIDIVGFGTVSLSAFAGSVLTIVLVYRLARAGGRTQIVTLLLAGFGVSTMLSYTTYFFELLNQNYGLGISMLVSWFHGTIDVPRWGQLAVSGTMMIAAFCASIPLARRLNTLALGDEYAQQLGLNPESTRIVLIVTGSLLVASAVSLGGLISFVGLVVPHLARLVMGPDNVRLLPVAAIAGALFLVVADTLARTLLAPTEIPVGVLSAFIGGPFFLYLLRRTKREYKL
ncbi:MAG: iron ABC transporter permease [Acidobacteria bacterium]|nr:iron ABC transporter permease [Acidobacteriota bacterium]